MQRLLVVDVARVYAEHAFEVRGLVYRVTHPVDVANIESVALLNLDIEAKGLVVDKVYRVTHNVGIAVALRIVEVEQLELILLVVLLHELAVLEEERTLLMCLFECAA